MIIIFMLQEDLDLNSNKLVSDAVIKEICNGCRQLRLVHDFLDFFSDLLCLTLKRIINFLQEIKFESVCCSY